MAGEEFSDRRSLNLRTSSSSVLRMPQEQALDRVPDGIELPREEWAKFSKKSRRFLVALAARHEEMKRLLAERQGGSAGPQEVGDQGVTPLS